MPATPVTDRLGFWGKLPTRGDFVGQNLPRRFVSCWDRWLSAELLELRDSQGAEWEEILDNAPACRFQVAAGALADAAYCGVFRPSRDSAGRRFPFTAAGAVAAEGSSDVAEEAWFAELEQAAMLAVETPLDPDEFAARIAEIPPPPPLVRSFEGAIKLFWGDRDRGRFIVSRLDQTGAWRAMVGQGSAAA